MARQAAASFRSQEIETAFSSRAAAAFFASSRPAIALSEGDRIEGDGWALETVLTPGHTANHACFALDRTGILFSADHVMAWATSIVAPPDGAMADYMASLERLLRRDDRIYFPGHGGPVREPQAFVRGLRMHRRMRERAILESVLSIRRAGADHVLTYFATELAAWLAEEKS